MSTLLGKVMPATAITVASASIAGGLSYLGRDILLINPVLAAAFTLATSLAIKATVIVFNKNPLDRTGGPGGITGFTVRALAMGAEYLPAAVALGAGLASPAAVVIMIAINHISRTLLAVLVRESRL